MAYIQRTTRAVAAALSSSVSHGSNCFYKREREEHPGKDYLGTGLHVLGTTEDQPSLYFQSLDSYGSYLWFPPSQDWTQQEAPTTFSPVFCFVVLNFCLHVAKASSLITGHKDPPHREDGSWCQGDSCHSGETHRHHAISGILELCSDAGTRVDISLAEHLS